MASVSALYGWVVGRYVIMPDHVHFFASPAPSEASKCIRGRLEEVDGRKIASCEQLDPTDLAAGVF